MTDSEGEISPLLPKGDAGAGSKQAADTTVFRGLEQTPERQVFLCIRWKVNKKEEVAREGGKTNFGLFGTERYARMYPLNKRT